MSQHAYKVARSPALRPSCLLTLPLLFKPHHRCPSPPVQVSHIVMGICKLWEGGGGVSIYKGNWSGV